MSDDVQDRADIHFNGAGDFTPASNDEAGESEFKAHIDVQRRVFITSNGNQIQLSDKVINALTVQYIQSQGKPEIPNIEVTLLGKHKQIEPFPQHEGYQARLREWQEQSNLAMMRYLFTLGVKGEPPEDFVETQREFFPDATKTEMKYLWVTSLVPDDDLSLFTEAIMGQNEPTEKGLEESAKSFRSKG